MQRNFDVHVDDMSSGTSVSVAHQSLTIVAVDDAGVRSMLASDIDRCLARASISAAIRSDISSLLMNRTSLTSEGGPLRIAMQGMTITVEAKTLASCSDLAGFDVDADPKKGGHGW